jgi:hypothetical protein
MPSSIVTAPADFEADLSPSQVSSMEKAASTQERGVQRRLCLLACSQDAEALRKLRAETPEAFTDMLQAIEAFKDHAQGLAEISEAAHMRMLLIDAEAGGCHV